jgi:HEPN domain-containing protein
VAQHAAEKALKALHYGRGARVVLGHSLVELVAPLVADHPELAGLRPAAQQLDQYYVPTRSPNGLPGGVPAEVYSERQASEGVAHARAFLDRVRAALPR